MIKPNMGIPGADIDTRGGGHSIADALFTASQQRVLSALFGQPDRSYYANELIGLAAGGTGAIQRELARLARSGLVTVRRIGNQKHYQANPDAPIYAELCSIASKTFALAEPLRVALQPIATDISFAFVYGSVARRSDSAASDIDLMVASKTLRYPEVHAALEAVRPRLARPLNVTLLTPDEIESRRSEQNSFLMRVLEQPKIWILGTPDDLTL